MAFTSFEFIMFFSAVFILYYTIPRRLQWILLLIASGFFYYLTGISNLAYMGATIVTTYTAAALIQRLHNAQKRFLEDKGLEKGEIKAYKSKNASRRLIILFLCLAVNFSLLGIVKVNAIAVLGISFYIFRSMSYIIDVNRGKSLYARNPFKFALFVSFFPLIMQGPIVRYDEVAPALFGGNKFSFKNASFGVQRVLWGFFKKLVIADRLSVAVAVLCGDPEQYGGVYALVAMFFYAVTLYCDFSGGIDITIGVAETLGIPVTENFNLPFLSRNIFEYWRRWHMTMGRWFREYLFYPLSVCKPMLKFGGFTRKRFGKFGKRIPVYIVTLVTWFSTGIWHGVSPNFIVWGLLNGIVIIISQELEPLYQKWNRFSFTKTSAYTCFRVFRTFWLMCFIRSYDCYNGVWRTFSVHLSVITDFGAKKFLSQGLSGLGLDIYDYVIVAAGIAVLLISVFIKTKLLKNGKDDENNESGEIGIRHWLSGKPMPLRFAVYGILLFSVIVFGVYGFGYNEGSFIYTRF